MTRTKYTVKEVFTPVRHADGYKDASYGVLLETFDRSKAIAKVEKQRAWYKDSSIAKQPGFEHYDWFIFTEEVQDFYDEVANVMINHHPRMMYPDARQIVETLVEEGYLKEENL